MASINTAERTAQLERDYKRNAFPSMIPLQRSLKIAKFATITLTADSVTADDDIVLGTIGVKGTLHPAFCRIVGLSGSVQGTVKLQKVDTAATVTDISGLATLATDGVEVPFLRASGALVSFEADDYLQLTIGTATALAAGDTIELVLAYSSDELQ